MSRTNQISEMVLMESGRTLQSFADGFTNCLDYGATVGGTAGANSTAINAAIVAATGTTGLVMVPIGVSYTESSLVIPDGVLLVIFSSNGTITYLSKDQGTALPVLKGGIVIKSQNNTGILLRSLDYGVNGEPVLQILDSANGDIAAIAPKFSEFIEISDPTAPSANKARLYTKDDGSGNTALAVRFPTGNVINICKEGQKSNIYASATWDPGNITNNSSEAKQISAVGAAMGDFVLASFSLDLQNLTISAHVTAADLVDVILQNATGGAVDLASGTVSVLVIKNW